MLNTLKTCPARKESFQSIYQKQINNLKTNVINSYTKKIISPVRQASFQSNHPQRKNCSTVEMNSRPGKQQLKILLQRLSTRRHKPPKPPDKKCRYQNNPPQDNLTPEGALLIESVLVNIFRQHGDQKTYHLNYQQINLNLSPPCSSLNFQPHP